MPEEARATPGTRGGRVPESSGAPSPPGHRGREAGDPYIGAGRLRAAEGSGAPSPSGPLERAGGRGSVRTGRAPRARIVAARRSSRDRSSDRRSGRGRSSARWSSPGGSPTRPTDRPGTPRADLAPGRSRTPQDPSERCEAHPDAQDAPGRCWARQKAPGFGIAPVGPSAPSGRVNRDLRARVSGRPTGASFGAQRQPARPRGSARTQRQPARRGPASGPIGIRPAGALPLGQAHPTPSGPAPPASGVPLRLNANPLAEGLGPIGIRPAGHFPWAKHTPPPPQAQHHPRPGRAGHRRARVFQRPAPLVTQLRCRNASLISRPPRDAPDTEASRPAETPPPPPAHTDAARPSPRRDRNRPPRRPAPIRPVADGAATVPANHPAEAGTCFRFPAGRANRTAVTVRQVCPAPNELSAPTRGRCHCQ